MRPPSPWGESTIRGASKRWSRALAERPELWREASAALASAGDRDLLDRLLPLLDSESSHVRSGAVRAIAAVTSSTPAGEASPVFEYTDEEGHRHPLF